MAPALSTHAPTTLDEALAENAALRKLVAELMARIAELETKLEASQARAKQNSQNSSRPPSSDPPDVKLNGGGMRVIHSWRVQGSSSSCGA